MNPTRPLIALVDDEECVRRAIKRLITSAGLDVVVFCAGREFLDALSSRRPDCLVLDLHMPGMSGFEIQSHLAEDGHKIPIVVITGHDTPDSRSRVLAAGAAAYLRKPVQGTLLLDAIMSAIASREN